MLTETSVQPVDPVVLENSDLPSGISELYQKAGDFLSDAYNEFTNNNLEKAMLSCRQFLLATRLPEQNRSTGENDRYHLRYIALSMFSNQHPFDDVMLIRETIDKMLEYSQSFFRKTIKKGITLENPVITKGDFYFIYSFCRGFYDMIINAVLKK